MFRNYFNTALRNFKKNKAHSFINIAGLSVGMAVAILIGLWIWDEVSFNKNFEHYNHIAQVMQSETLNGKINTGKGNVMPLAAELRRTHGSDFKYVVLSSWSMNSIINAGEKKISIQGNYMEPDAPDLLSLIMVKGTRQAFKSPSAVLLSSSTAKVLFGNEDPIGRLLKIDGDLNEKVAGVYEDFPQSCSFKDVSFIAPFLDLKSWVTGNENNWYNESFQVFVQIADHADFTKLTNKIKDIKLNKVDAQTARLEHPQMLLQPMSKWHLHAEYTNGVNTGGAIRYVWIFTLIGTFVLLLACINFMNLSTARSEKRAKEVGIRKAVGSLRNQLISQFFLESVLTAMMAFAIALVLVLLVLPVFNDLSGKQTHLPWRNIIFWMMGIGFGLLTGIISGIYPALYLSSFQPVKILKGTFKAGRYAAMPRRVLIVLQFSVSVLLIISTVVVYRQIQFAKSRPVGYSRQGLITIIMKTYNYHRNLSNMRADLLRQGAITEIAESNTPVTENDHYNNGFSWQGKDAQVSAKFNTVNVSTEYAKTVGLEFMEGRGFSDQFKTDSTAVILNEAAVKYTGFQNPLNKTIRREDKSFTVIGVVKDVVMESPYEQAKPTLFFLDSAAGGIVNIRLSPNLSAASALAKVESVCKKYSPEEPFDYTFADEDYARKFMDEERIGKLANSFSILAIFISCLGLFGMASFMAEQRTKEIGVRKVLGASVADLWQLLSKDFVLLVIVSMLIASPVAYYAMSNWLQRYEYRAEISWWIFAGTGITLVMITLLTVSYQSIKAALVNPVKSLKTE